MRSPSLLGGKHRMLALLLVGCNVFFLLSTFLGHPTAPTFDQPDKFPLRIWQSWKVDVLRFEDRDNERARSWTKLNPKHRYEVFTDDNAEDYVEQVFGPTGFNRPDIVTTYKAMSQPNTRIIQADLLRYIILYAEGGLWADIDVEATQAIDRFIPNSFKESDISMVIGIETDEPDLRDHPFLGSKAQSFCQWTFMCKPRLPVMMRLINNILIWLHKLSEEQRKPIWELELDFDTVLSGTGPSAFTDAILAEMSVALGRQVTWDTFHDLQDSKLVAGVLVLPSEAFAAGTGHSRSGNHGGKRALVKHHFHASSWTKKHQRKKHPIYDEVEKCNWNLECVALWDANTAHFDSLSEEEQLRMIEDKRLARIKGVPFPAGNQQQAVMAAPPPPPPPPPPPALPAAPAAPAKQEKPAVKDKPDSLEEEAKKPAISKGTQEETKKHSKAADIKEPQSLEELAKKPAISKVDASKDGKKPVEKSSDKPAEKSSGEPAEKSSGKPIEKSSGKPIEKSSGKPAEKSSDEPAEKSSDEPTEKSSDKPKAETNPGSPADEPVKADASEASEEGEITKGDMDDLLESMANERKAAEEDERKRKDTL